MPEIQIPGIVEGVVSNVIFKYIVVACVSSIVGWFVRKWKADNRDSKTDVSDNIQDRLDSAITAVQCYINTEEALSQPTYSALWQLVHCPATQAGLVIYSEAEHGIALGFESYGSRYSVIVRLSGFSEPTSIGERIHYNGNHPLDEEMLLRDALIDALRLPRHTHSEQAVQPCDDDDVLDDLPW